MLLLVVFVGFFPQHPAVSIYQPSVPVSRYFLVPKVALNHIFIYIFKTILTAQKDPTLSEKARSRFGQHILIAQVNSIKTFLRTVGTRGLFGGSFL